MPSLKAIKRRIAGVSSTQQIVRAMDMVSASKLQGTRARLEPARNMKNSMAALMDGIRNCHLAAQNPFVAPREQSRRAYIVITSDRGLCGSYNLNLTRYASSSIKGHGNDSIIAVGLQGWEYFKNRDVNILQGFSDISETALYEDAQRIGELIIDLYTSNNIDEVYVIYTRFDSVLMHLPQTEKLLPVGSNEEKALWYDTMIYEPDPDQFLEYAVPLYLNAFIYRAMVESACCENAARMTSMHSAANNADEIIQRMTREYNRTRQSMVTQEITEIVGGAKALQQSREKKE